MLKTIIYVSRLKIKQPISFLKEVLKKAQKTNQLLDVTGILLFDGTSFMQILEGPSDGVDQVYNTICNDTRHSQIIELLADYSPARYFCRKGMDFFDISDKKEDFFQQICQLSTIDYEHLSNKRIFKFINKFINGNIYNPLLKDEEWIFVQNQNADTKISIPDAAISSYPCAYAFQPILDPLTQKIYYLEALVRTPQGGSAFEYLSSIPSSKTYWDDIHSKKYLFSIASHVLKRTEKVSINIMPESLVINPDAPAQILQYAKDYGITPDRVVVEITENELASDFAVFLEQIKVLKSYGFMIALDDFGSGYAGLSMLTQIKPDKIKLDRIIICDIHKKAINQAVVRSVISFCSELEIELVAEGVEDIDEWLWLKSVGIKRIQGFLFSKGCVNNRPDIFWPEPAHTDTVNAA